MEPTEDTPKLAQGAVLVESEEMPEGTPSVQGFAVFAFFAFHSFWMPFSINFEEHVTIGLKRNFFLPISLSILYLFIMGGKKIKCLVNT